MARALRGDVDTILLKALRKKPEERYATVNALANARSPEDVAAKRGKTVEEILG